MNFETVIGIEIHLELKTKTKMFSPASNTFGNTPNSNVSPIDLAFPGTMPRLNKKAVEYAIKAATVLNCTIDNEIWFDRKNYFYPDLPKGYQITQDKRPIGRHGYVDIRVDGVSKRINIERIHMEEDTAKQLHFDTYTLLDYNRCGVPLVEIVTDASIRSGKEAAEYVSKLRQLMLYTGISDAKMEEGSLRCDVNISLRPYGQKEYGVKTEIKNLNSISNVEKAIDFEVARQERILLSGGKVIQETRRFDETKKETVLMRVKTDAIDYKYFTEPNIKPIKLDPNWIKEIQGTIPLLPDARFNRYVNELGLSEYDASIIVATKEMSDYFEVCLTTCKEAKMIANWLMGDVSGYLNKNNLEIKDFKIQPENLAKLVSMIATNEISSKQAKQVFEIMLEGQEKDPTVIAKKQGMMQITDPKVITELVNQVLDENPNAITTYKQGRDNILGFLVGMTIKKSKGQANPAIVNTIMREEISKR
jgi:aspartyl-tRNA(Asn)/glutamyl-tRNA(Gln) amidotransferase subunit B